MEKIFTHSTKFIRFYKQEHGDCLKNACVKILFLILCVVLILSSHAMILGTVTVLVYYFSVMDLMNAFITALCIITFVPIFIAIFFFAYILLNAIYNHFQTTIDKYNHIGGRA